MKTLLLVIKLLPQVYALAKKFTECVADKVITQEEAQELSTEVIKLGYDVVNAVKEKCDATSKEQTKSDDN